jgi:CheY-like chemotaxis protein
VDDEAGLRKAVARFLNRRGMQCRAVGDGAEALEVLRFQDFDVIISDVRMPGMNGREFLDQLRATHPDRVRRLIFSTGDTFARDTADLLKESGVPSLVKPFDFAKLEGLVREVAARPATPA